MRIRPAAPGELPALQDLERAAGAPFRDVGMPDIAEDEPPALDLLERYRRAGRCWVAADEADADAVGDDGGGEGGGEGGDRLLGYLIAEPVDGALHVEQVSVHPGAARRGVGRALLSHAARHAREEGLAALTLTTFAGVPWNAPYYARLGFRTLAGPGLTPGLRRIRAEEAGHGLARWPRVCMRLDIPRTGGTSGETVAPGAVPVTIRPARERDVPGLLGLAAQVEQWFGPMVEEAGFHAAVREDIAGSTALVAPSSGPDLLGGLLFASAPPVYHVHWLVVSRRARGTGVGRALMTEAVRRWVRGPGEIEVVTFGPDHPGAVDSGARAFYERLGFVPAEAAAPGPEGGSRQVFRRAVA